ncbi:hypothetical protein ACF1BU_29020 [Streptomyces sp. NPDC014724]|uniref:hypothetical protein n=1 Tax=unclassified Streptomyces TaxID=2593676 RepID=UPI0036F4CEF5
MIDNLNQASVEFIEEARRVHGLERVRLLRSSTTSSNHPFLDRFNREVIDGYEPPDKWGLGGVLVPDLSLPELLDRSASEILKPFGNAPHDGWSYIVFDQATDRYDPNGGAPAAIRVDLHYSWIPPKDVVRIAPSAVTLNHTEDVQISIRRWIAFRVSLALGHNFHLQVNAEEIIRSVDSDMNNLSDDALMAIKGLATETGMPNPLKQIYGFIGPSEIYRG